MADQPTLHAVLGSIQARGAIGTSSLDDAVAHAGRFVSLVPASARRLADLGSGGGLPGLVIAASLPHLEVVLVERREMRADLLRRAVRALAMTDRVRVHGGDVRTIATSEPGSFDVVTARSFASPAVTARWAATLVRVGGVVLVSEPPDAPDGRWPATLLGPLGLHNHGVDQGIRALHRR